MVRVHEKFTNYYRRIEYAEEKKNCILGAPYQNFWPQPMTTYILPQSAATPAPGQVIINTSGAQQTPTAAQATLIHSTATSSQHNNTSHNNPSTNPTGRRSSPPSNHHHYVNNGGKDNNSSSVSTPMTMHATAVPLQTFPPSVPLSTEAAGQASGPQTIYALPPSMYPYQPATAGFYQPLPHHPPANTTIISSVIPQHPNAHPTPPIQHPPPPGTHPSTPHSYHSNAGAHITTTGEIVTTHFPFTPQSSAHQSTAVTNNNSTSTPQSTPSTPITVQPNFKNPPLFATPPIIASVTSTPSAQHSESHKNAGSGTGYVPKKFNNGSAINTPPLPAAKSINQRHSVGGGAGGGYQSTMNNAQGGKKSINYNNPTNPNNNNNSSNNNSNSSSEDTTSLTLSNSSNYRAKNRDQSSAGSNYQPKTSSYVPKGQQPYSNSQSPNSNDNSSEQTNKFIHRGPNRSVPPSLDLKRNNSNTNFMTNNYHHNRSTPSTNSTESNNSPNSITSYDHSRNFHYSHNPTHFIRGGSAGPAGSMNNPNEGQPMPTCFPFNVQNPAGSAQLIDPCQNQALIGYNNGMAAGMYVKLGPAITYANVSLSLC